MGGTASTPGELSGGGAKLVGAHLSRRHNLVIRVEELKLHRAVFGDVELAFVLLSFVRDDLPQQLLVGSIDAAVGEDERRLLSRRVAIVAKIHRVLIDREVFA